MGEWYGIKWTIKRTGYKFIYTKNRKIVERQIVANPNIKLNLSFFTLFPQIIPAFSSIPSDYS